MSIITVRYPSLVKKTPLDQGPAYHNSITTSTTSMAIIIMKQIVIAIISIAVVTITLLVDESVSFVLKQQPQHQPQPHTHHHKNIIRNDRSSIRTMMSALSSPPAVPVDKVIVLEDAEAVGKLQKHTTPIYLLLYNNLCA